MIALPWKLRLAYIFSIWKPFSRVSHQWSLNQTLNLCHSHVDCWVKPVHWRDNQPSLYQVSGYQCQMHQSTLISRPSIPWQCLVTKVVIDKHRAFWVSKWNRSSVNYKLCFKWSINTNGSWYISVTIEKHGLLPIRKSIDYVYGIWQHKVLGIKKTIWE